MTTFSSPNWLTEEQLRERDINPNQDEEFRRYYYQQAFGIEVWYERLKQFTFPTSFLPLSMNDVNAILNKHNKTATEDDDIVLEQLKESVSELMLDYEQAGVFLKLNTRSPKDVCIDLTNDSRNVNQLLQWVEEDLCDQEALKYSQAVKDDLLKASFTAEQIMKAFTKACTRSMRIQSAEDALILLTQSSRVSQDLTRVQCFGLNNAKPCIVIREWNDNVVYRPHMEFRGFVYKNQLNAVSQYDNVTYYEELHRNKDKIAEDILRFFNENVRDHLTDLESYVIDFFIDIHDIKIIELNPFHNGAGACLFSWREDRELFMNGPYTFRVREDSYPDPLGALHGFWERKLKYYERQAGGSEENTIVSTLRQNIVPFSGILAVSAVAAVGAFFLMKRSQNTN